MDPLNNLFSCIFNLIHITRYIMLLSTDYFWQAALSLTAVPYQQLNLVLSIFSHFSDQSMCDWCATGCTVL